MRWRQTRRRRTVHSRKRRRLEREDAGKINILHHHWITAMIKRTHVSSHAEAFLIIVPAAFPRWAASAEGCVVLREFRPALSGVVPVVCGGDDGDGATEGGYWEMGRRVYRRERSGGVAISGCSLWTFWPTVLVFRLSRISLSTSAS